MCVIRDMAVAGDVESIVHCMLHYFFDAVMAVVQVLLYAHRYYFMHTGITLCVQVLIYAYRYYFMHTGITLCVQVLIYAYRY